MSYGMTEKEKIKLKEYYYDGQKINCPDCGEEITIEYDTARCDSCGWMAADSELNEIMTP